MGRRSNKICNFGENPPTEKHDMEKDDGFLDTHCFYGTSHSWIWIRVGCFGIKQSGVANLYSTLWDWFSFLCVSILCLFIQLVNVLTQCMAWRWMLHILQRSSVFVLDWIRLHNFGFQQNTKMTQRVRISGWTNKSQNISSLFQYYQPHNGYTIYIAQYCFTSGEHCPGMDGHWKCWIYLALASLFDFFLFQFPGSWDFSYNKIPVTPHNITRSATFCTCYKYVGWCLSFLFHIKNIEFQTAIFFCIME